MKLYIDPHFNILFLLYYQHLSQVLSLTIHAITCTKFLIGNNVFSSRTIKHNFYMFDERWCIITPIYTSTFLLFFTTRNKFFLSSPLRVYSMLHIEGGILFVNLVMVYPRSLACDWPRKGHDVCREYYSLNKICNRHVKVLSWFVGQSRAKSRAIKFAQSNTTNKICVCCRRVETRHKLFVQYERKTKELENREYFFNK